MNTPPAKKIGYIFIQKWSFNPAVSTFWFGIPNFQTRT
ncbi:hypothetical protein ASZ90_007358 [hydrocarbon metagenome]|uniref:Uncharacterized protein n=1 Tax=hydrocarbon metagenome TaxID=938273 RepID=A0A0W8FPP4_9ZZZZ